MSGETLLHFTRDSSLEQILMSGRLEPGKTPFGVYPIPETVHKQHRSVCLSELPFEDALHLAQRHGRWGIAFRRERLIRSGARKVEYIEGAEVHRIRAKQRKHAEDPDADLWQQTPFLSPVTENHSWEWEQEWRHPGTFLFDWDDIEFLISPDGARLKMVAEDDLGSLYTADEQGTDGGVLLWEDGESLPFNRVMQSALENIARNYVTPDDACLPRDDEDESGYFWFTAKWETWDILAEEMPAAPHRIMDALVRDLDGKAMYFALASDLENFGPDTD